MKTSHLSPWEQEEYVMRQPTPPMLRHLAQCSSCRAEVERLEQGISLFRDAAVEWSAQRLARQPRAVVANPPGRIGWWAWAAVVPLLVLVFALLSFERPSRPPLQPLAAISDDALLDQVDEQLSVAVPSSMESLTHLVSTKAGGRSIVQSN